MYKTFLKRFYCQICMPVCPCGASRELRVDAHFLSMEQTLTFMVGKTCRVPWSAWWGEEGCCTQAITHISGLNPLFSNQTLVLCTWSTLGSVNLLVIQMFWGGNQPVPAVGMARKEGGCCLKGSWWGKPKGRSLLSNPQGQLVWAAWNLGRWAGAESCLWSLLYQEVGWQSPLR